jgi:hypothetical protein
MAVPSGIECFAVDDDRDALDGILHQRWFEDWRALEDESFSRSHHTIDDGALQQLPAGTYHQPSKAVQPAPPMQHTKEALVVTAVLY